MNDDVLFVRKVMMGDKAAIESFYRSLRDITFALGRKKGLNRDDIEDLIGDLFEKLIMKGKLNSYSGRSQLTTWLFQVILREIIDRLRKEQRVTPVDPSVIGFIGITTDTDPERTYLESKLMEAIEQLDTDLRRTVKLYLLGYKPAEIARLMNLPPRRVYKFLEKSKRKLKKKLSKYWEG